MKHSGTYDCDEFEYRTSFIRVLTDVPENLVPTFAPRNKIAQQNNMTRASTLGCNLLFAIGKARFIVEFKVNKKADDAIATIDKYKEEIHRDVDDILCCVGINYQPERILDMEYGIICTWIIIMYLENGKLKTPFARGEFTWSNLAAHVPIKRESVYDHYNMLQIIGTGVSAVVYECRRKETGEVFVAKSMRLAEISVFRKNKKSNVYREIKIMSQLDHPNLLTLYEVFEYDGQVTLIMEQ